MKRKLTRVAFFCGLIASFFCMYYVYNYDLYRGEAFFLGCILYPIGILCFSLGPVEGILGRWLIPIYALTWTVLDWVLLNEAWKNKSSGEEGLGVAMFVLLFQMVGNVPPFCMKRQRWIRSRLGIALMLFYPGSFIFMMIMDK